MTVSRQYFTYISHLILSYSDWLWLIFTFHSAVFNWMYVWTEKLTEDQQEIVETAAEVLYGLIHARYILTGRGMHRMYVKYQDADFGSCPRVCCQGQHCLPVGMSDQQRTCPVNVYCPRCQELYYPRSTKQAGLDGAYFGTTFAHMFLLTYPDSIPRRPLNVAENSDRYIPKIYGFRIHQDSSYYKLRYAMFILCDVKTVYFLYFMIYGWWVLSNS